VKRKFMSMTTDLVPAAVHKGNLADIAVDLPHRSVFGGKKEIITRR